MFETDRTPWKMHLLPSDLADRCFRVFCRWVILGGWPSGGGGPPKKKKKVAQNLLKHALILEFLKSDKIFFAGWGGGGPKIKVVQNVLKHALVLEFLKSGQIFFFWGKKFTDRQTL